MPEEHGFSTRAEPRFGPRHSHERASRKPRGQSVAGVKPRFRISASIVASRPRKLR